MDRRRFLGTTLASFGLLGLGSGAYYTLVSDNEAELTLRALIATVLYHPEQKLSHQQLTKISDDVQVAISYLDPATRDELEQLFDLFRTRLFALLIEGQWIYFRELSLSQKLHFFESWRQHFMGLMQMGFDGFKELVMAAYYGDPDNWSHLNYQKPW